MGDSVRIGERLESCLGQERLVLRRRIALARVACISSAEYSATGSGPVLSALMKASWITSRPPTGRLRNDNCAKAVAPGRSDTGRYVVFTWNDLGHLNGIKMEGR